MPNILNRITAARRMRTPEEVFTYDSTGRTKPMKNEAVLLPSKIIGSPIEYAKDLTKDVISVGKAAKGKANDHELGRINSLAMKAGSLAIASYLYVKNPFKFNKVMEFAGFGAFFGAMALWPKLAIQLPLRKRTGVDFMRQYVDSQGRKKMLYQDPQYDLTDMLPRRELEKIGNKMGVDKNLPDRDRFIKQRARKTALQANTLWMVTAGAATPVLSALICNRSEKFIKSKVERHELNRTTGKFLSSAPYEDSLKKHRDARKAQFGKFIESNGDKPLLGEIPAIFAQLRDTLAETSSLALEEPLKIELERLAVKELTTEQIEKVLKVDLKSLDDASISVINYYIEKYGREHQTEGLQKITRILENKGLLNGMTQEEACTEIMESLKTTSLRDVKRRLAGLFGAFEDYAMKKKQFDEYVNARIGGTGAFQANQWEKVENSLIDFLRVDDMFTTKGLRRTAANTPEAEAYIKQRFTDLAAAETTYPEALREICEHVYRYENGVCLGAKTGGLLDNVRVITAKELLQDKSRSKSNRTYVMFDTFRAELDQYGFSELSKYVAGDCSMSGPPVTGTLYKTAALDAEAKVLGAHSSLMRVILALDTHRQARTGVLKENILKIMHDKENPIPGIAALTPKQHDELITKIEAKCKEIILDANPIDFTEKFITQKYNLTREEYKIVTRALFDPQCDTAMSDALASAAVEKDKINSYVSMVTRFKTAFMQHVVNWQNIITPEHSKRISGKNINSSLDSAKRFHYSGKNIIQLVSEAAQKRCNSKSWFLLFGGIMAGLTAATLAAGMMLGRKPKMEQQAEEESRKNG